VDRADHLIPVDAVMRLGHLYCYFWSVNRAIESVNVLFVCRENGFVDKEGGWQARAAPVLMHPRRHAVQLHTLARCLHLNKRLEVNSGATNANRNHISSSYAGVTLTKRTDLALETAFEHGTPFPRSGDAL
jgi:hypothetical protein